jgi:tetraacyldisaccharide 4'-kinase
MESRLSFVSYLKNVVSEKKSGVVANFVRGCLWLAALPYRWVVAIRNGRFDQGKGVARARVPVISIGNLTTGGTGKTPLVCYLATRLRQLELRVSILSRGYGANEAGVNDEALELEMRLPDVPHLQDPNRKKIADIATEELAAEVLLLDDGFQHRKLHRDIDIVVIDATNPFGFGHLLPRGLLREPIQNIQRADLAVINRCNFVDDTTISGIKTELRKFKPTLPIALAWTVVDKLVDCDGNAYDMNDFKGKSVATICGIGNPKGFQITLEQIEINVIASKTFPDHHRYSRADIEQVSKWVEALEGCDALLCTQKDLVKINLHKIANVHLLAVQISTKIKRNEKVLWETIHAKMQDPPAP